MKRKNYIVCSLLAASLLASCSTHELTEEQPEASKGACIEIYSAEYSAEWSQDSRSLKPMDDQLQKMIHNLYFLYYDSEGRLAKVAFRDITPASLIVKDQRFHSDADNPVPGHPLPTSGTLYVIANSERIDSSNENPITPNLTNWPVSIEDFKEKAMLPLYYGTNSLDEDRNTGRPGHLMMFGSYEGSFTNTTTPIRMILGRVAARINVVLSGPGLGQRAKITMTNVPIRTSMFPQMKPLPDTFIGNNGVETKCWGEYNEEIATKALNKTIAVR